MHRKPSTEKELCTNPNHILLPTDQGGNIKMLRNSGKKIPLFTEVKINKPKNKINLKKKPFNSIKYSQRFGHTVNPYNHTGNIHGRGGMG